MADDQDVPNITDSPTTDDMLRELLANQQAQRAEVAELRAELDKARTAPAVAPTSTVQSPEVLAAQRQQELDAFEFYCPGCGALSHYQRACTGRGEAPHPPIEVVSTDEIKGDNATDPSKHTAAPGVAP